MVALYHKESFESKRIVSIAKFVFWVCFYVCIISHGFHSTNIQFILKNLGGLTAAVLMQGGERNEIPCCKQSIIYRHIIHPGVFCLYISRETENLLPEYVSIVFKISY